MRTGRTILGTTCALLLVGSAMAACGRDEPPAPEPTPTASPVEIRGYPVPDFACAIADPVNLLDQETIVGTVEILVCGVPTGLPGQVVRAAKALDSTDPGFDPLLAALALPDVLPPDVNATCQTINLPRPAIVIRTQIATYQGVLPRDGCGISSQATNAIDDILRDQPTTTPV